MIDKMAVKVVLYFLCIAALLMFIPPMLSAADWVVNISGVVILMASVYTLVVRPIAVKLLKGENK